VSILKELLQLLLVSFICLSESSFWFQIYYFIQKINIRNFYYFHFYLVISFALLQTKFPTWHLQTLSKSLQIQNSLNPTSFFLPSHFYCSNLYYYFIKAYTINYINDFHLQFYYNSN
jgi:hypothetical protein